MATDLSGEVNVRNAAAVGVLVALAVVVLKTLDFLFIPLSIAMLIFYAIGAPFVWLERHGFPAWLRIVTVVLFMAGLFFLLGRLVQANIADFAAMLPALEQKFWGYAERLLIAFDTNREEVRTLLATYWQGMGASDLKPFGDAVQKVGTSFFSLLANVFWVLLFLVFIMAERESIADRIVTALGENKARPVLDAAVRVNEAVQHYLGLKTLVSLLTGVLAGVVLWFFGVPFALLWAVLTFLLNFIPNIGSLIASVPPVAVALFQSGSLARSGAVLAVLVVIQVGVGNFLEPKLMGRGLNMSPLVVLLSLILWGWLWGGIGMLLSVPLTAAIKIAFEQVDATRPVALLMRAK